MIPRDQISALVLYVVFEITSGAIQKGVPMQVSRWDCIVLIPAAMPKSAAVHV